MYLTVAIVLCVFGVGTAQYNNQQYQPNQPTYNNGNIQLELASLEDQVAALGNRFEGLENRVNSLTLRVAGQKDVINKFYTLDIPQIDLDQAKINSRLDKLAEKIAAINNLRDEVKEIAEEAATLKKTAESVYIPKDEELLAEAEKLKTADVERQALIDELTLKEVNVEERVDALFDSVTNTASEQQKLERDIRYVIIGFNNATAVSASATVVLNQGQGSTSVTISPMFTRVPLSAPSSVVGFKAVRDKKYTSYGDNNRQEVAFKSEVIVCDNLVFSARERGAGGWNVESIDVTTLAQ